MKRRKIIQGAFCSVDNTWSIGYISHSDITNFLNYNGFKIENISNITDYYYPNSITPIMNDVYIYYSYLSGGNMIYDKTSLYLYYGKYVDMEYVEGDYIE